MENKKKYLIALTSGGEKVGFCCPTILVRANDEKDAVAIASSKGHRHFGKIKEVNY